MPDTTTHMRRVAQVVPARPTIEGGGIRVNRPFPIPGADWFDPFLLLDEMARTHHDPGPPSGVPPHPHRGFETVTYVFEGEIEHQDSAGNHGLIGPGDVQWMTAGDGIVHSEMHSEKLQREGGTSHGLQLWVNLPAGLRRATPRYQGLTSEDVPTVRGDGWSAHLVAGELDGEWGPAESHTPILYAMVTVGSGATARIPVAEGHTALAYLVDGPAAVGPEPRLVDRQHLVVFEPGSGDVVITAADSPVRALVLGGEPVGEPMVRYGPFVMNTVEELQEAIDDFNAGRMGQLVATRRGGSPRDSTSHPGTSPGT